MYITLIEGKTFITEYSVQSQDLDEASLYVKASTIIEAARELFQHGLKLSSIKLVRSSFDLSLKEAKDLCESLFTPEEDPCPF